MNRPEQIRRWVEREFKDTLVEKVVQDLLDVATGSREGNTFEKEALKRIFARKRFTVAGDEDWGYHVPEDPELPHFDRKQDAEDFVALLNEGMGHEEAWQAVKDRTPRPGSGR
jgi:hypothetical protein